MASTPIGLVLPGMTLNETVFPALPLDTITIDFTTLVLGPDGSSPDLEARGMGVYCDLLTERLERDARWTGSETRIVVAHSFGGMLALAWLLANQATPIGRVDGVVLVATSAGPMFDAVGLRLCRLGSRELRIGVRALIALWNRPVVTRSVKRLLSGGALTARPVDFRTLRDKSDWAVDRAGWRNTDWRAMRSFRLGMQSLDLRGDLGKLDVPAIILHGTRDTLFGGENARTLSEGLRRAELRWVPGAGHMLPLTHGEAVTQAVRDLLPD